MEYLLAGNLMVDTILFRDGSKTDQLGGPAPFAYTGVKLWTDNCKLVCNVGNDFNNYYGEWCRANQVNRDSICILGDYCNHTELGYNDDGTYGITDYMAPLDLAWMTDYLERLGYLRIRPKDIERAIGDDDIKGVYLSQDCDRVFWEQIGEIKKRHPFTMMWEIETRHALRENLDDVLYALQWVDLFSVNLPECQKLFELEEEQKIVERLKEIPVTMTVFRVGERGLYVIYGAEDYFFPSASNDGVIDPTGCGNSSTGAALYAYCETKDPICVGIIANVASSINLGYKGLIPDLMGSRETAEKKREVHEAEYRKNQNK